MKNKELVTVLAENLSATLERKVSQKEAKDIYQSVVDTIADGIVEGKKITLPGVGAFSLVERKARTGVIQFGENKGQTYTAPAHKAVQFKPSTAFKEEVAELK